MSKEMRHSGIEWIGEIPKEWNCQRLKFLCSIQTGNQDTQDANSEGEYPFYVRSPLVERSSKYSFDGEGILMAGDGVGAGRVFHHAFGKYAVHQRVYRLSSFTNIVPNYLFNYISNLFTRVMDMGSAQSTVPSVRLPMLSNFTVCIPPLSEQQKIANYLDKVCGEVDEMISLQEQMIEELKAYKQSVITEAVTKGLNPDVPMHDSGIDWIGEVPDHWEVKKIGYVFYNLDYLREPISAELRERNNPQYDYYGASGVIDKIDHYNVEDKVLLIGEDGANLVMRNLPLIYKAEGKFWVNNHAHILKPIKDDYNYMAHTLEAADYRNYITGFAQPKLSQENLKAVKLPVPPLSEQQSIASYLDTKCAEIDALIAIKQAKIEELKKYKKSVIYEYVTGKKEVV